MERFWRVLFEHPLIKAVALGLFGILGNVLAGAYVFEITETANGVQFINWQASLHSRPFWALFLVLVGMGLYGWGMARFETRVRKALSEADLQAIALQELLGPMIEAAKKDIREGKLRSMEDVKKMFGLDKGDQA